MTTETPARTLDRTTHIGSRPLYPDSPRRDVFVRIRYANGELSISGVEGPKPNGDAHGSSGQITMHYKHRNPAHDDQRTSDPVPASAFTFAGGWTEELWLELLDVWETFHLNHMHAACEHQRAAGWREAAREPRIIYHWRLNPIVSAQVRDALREAEKDLRAGKTVTLGPETQALAAHPYAAATASPEPPAPVYEPAALTAYSRPQETKARGWLRPDEHPDGLLTKPCPECGYRYGTAWQREDVPGEVLDWLERTPLGVRTPAWA